MKLNTIGIDEAGRGPLAGPVAVGAVCIPKNFDWKLILGVNDSKKLSHKNREAIFMRTGVLKKEGKLDYSVSMVSASVIDRIGIVPSVQLGISRCLNKINKNPRVVSIKLDGLLSAPKEYENQKTITKGDEKEKIIGLASIMAKVTRDRYMIKIAKKYPKYGLETHKGYGTKEHRGLIIKNNISEIHRVSFCKNVLNTKQSECLSK